MGLVDTAVQEQLSLSGPTAKTVWERPLAATGPADGSTAPISLSDERRVTTAGGRGATPGRNALNSHAARALRRILKESLTVRITQRDRLVIMSDLHVGDGGPQDDFRHNAPLVLSVLRNYYLSNRFGLILNGDIEELHKFSLSQIHGRWGKLYDLFEAFARGTGLFRIVGNHDYDLRKDDHCRPETSVHEALNLDFEGNRVFILHGCQSSPFYHAGMLLGRLLLRYVAAPLGIMNYSIAHDDRRKFRVERRLYEYARDTGVAVVIGHTHRPLFESFSKVDWLKVQIEQLCRAYGTASEGERSTFKSRIRRYRKELQRALKSHGNNDATTSLYGSGCPIPCLFNSGCTIGKRGITALEIAGGNIALVHWFDRNRSTKFFHLNGYKPERLGSTDYFRVVLKQERLSAIFARIKPQSSALHRRRSSSATDRLTRKLTQAIP